MVLKELEESSAVKGVQLNAGGAGNIGAEVGGLEISTDRVERAAAVKFGVDEVRAARAEVGGSEVSRAEAERFSAGISEA